MDETIQGLAARNRKELIEESFGFDKGKVHTFSVRDVVIKIIADAQALVEIFFAGRGT